MKRKKANFVFYVFKVTMNLVVYLKFFFFIRALCGYKVCEDVRVKYIIQKAKIFANYVSYLKISDNTNCGTFFAMVCSIDLKIKILKIIIEFKCE